MKQLEDYFKKKLSQVNHNKALELSKEIESKTGLKTRVITKGNTSAVIPEDDKLAREVEFGSDGRERVWRKLKARKL
jgi:hypothetical protein